MEGNISNKIEELIFFIFQKIRENLFFFDISESFKIIFPNLSTFFHALCYTCLKFIHILHLE